MWSSLKSPTARFAAQHNTAGSEAKRSASTDIRFCPQSLPRRRLLIGLAILPLLGLPRLARANNNVLGGMKRWGSGEFRRFGFLIYSATLWASDDPHNPPLALRLDYQRHIAGKAIALASVKEMRRFVSDEARLQSWGEAMARIFPDVKPGDHIIGVHAEDRASFYQNGRLLGSIDEAGFADAFFAIWLDPRTSAPELRASLLRPGEA